MRRYKPTRSVAVARQRDRARMLLWEAHVHTIVRAAQEEASPEARAERVVREMALKSAGADCTILQGELSV